MNITCNIVKDLLPIYHDGVCSDDSRTLVEEHLKHCQNCQDELDQYTKEMSVEKTMKLSSNVGEANALKGIAEKWRKDKRVSFFKGVTWVSVMGCILSIFAYNINGSYVDENGYLVEVFGFIPLAYLFALMALVSGLALVALRFLKNK